MHALIQLIEQSPMALFALTFIVSLMVGSFLNVVIYRLPIMMERQWKRDYQSYFNAEESTGVESKFNLIKPDSTCPKCQHKIRAWENIPVISWLVLGGKCSQCKNPISIRYPLVELLTAVMSTWAAIHFGFGGALIFAVIATWLLVAMTFIDLDKMLLPDQLTLMLLWLGLLISPWSVFVSPKDAIIGAAAGYLSLWSVYWAFKLLTGKEGMGYGDFKLLAALGAWCGWQHLAIIVILSSFVGAIVGIVLMMKQNKGTNLAIPFGPYLAIAGWLTLLYGDKIAKSYWQMVMA